MGLYYELMTPIQHVNGVWRTTIFLETEGLHAFLPLYRRRWEQVAAQCRIMFGNNCARSPGYPQLLRKMAASVDLLEELQGAIGELEEHSRAHSPEYLPASIHRKRRTVPWFGFIGKLAGPTLGVLTYEDGERYERVISELNEAQRNVSHLVGQQTHVVRSELQKLHHLEEHHEKIMKGLKARLGEAATGIDKLSNEFTKLNYTTILEHMTLELAEGLNNYQQSVRRLIDVIHAAGEGRLHPA